MIAKPIRVLELRHPMIQFLIEIIIILSNYFSVSDWIKEHA